MAVIRKGKGMTLIQLIRNAQQYEAWDRPKTDGLRKRESRLKLAKTEVLPNIKFKDVLVNVLHTKPHALRFYTHILNENKDGRYPAYIDFMMAGKGKNVQLNCGCYDNWGRANYANYKAGVSFQHTSDGKKQNSKNKMKLPFMCVAKDTLVTTISGDKNIQDIIEGDSVLTLKGYKRVTKAWQSGTKSVVRVTTKGGHSMDITPDHRVLTFKDNKFQYTEIRNLTKGDYLFQLPHTGNSKFTQNDAAGVVAGILISEADEFGYSPVEPIVKKIFEKNYKEVFGTRPNYKNVTSRHIMLNDIHDVARELGFSFKKSKNQRLPRSYLLAPESFRSSLLYGLFLGDGSIADTYATYGTTSHGLALDVQNLMRGLGVYSMIRKNGQDNIWHVRVPSTSRQKLLNCFGKRVFKYPIPAYEASTAMGHENTLPFRLKNWVLQLRREAYQHLEMLEMPETTSYLVKAGSVLLPLRLKFPEHMYSVELAGSLKRTVFTPVEIRDYLLLDETRASRSLQDVPTIDGGMTYPILKQWVKTCKVPNTEQVEYLRDIVNSNTTTQKIDSIELVGRTAVYDLEVEGAHHFLANGFVVHNCKHLHAFSFKLLQEKMLNTDLTLAPEVLRVAKNTIAQLEAKKRKSQKQWTDTFEELFTGTPQKVSASTKLKPDK